MIEDLVPYNPHHLKALLASHRIDNHVSMNPNKVLVVEYRVFILSRRVDDLHRKVLVSVADDLAECVFNGGVVGVDKVAIDVLNGQGTLACERERGIW